MRCSGQLPQHSTGSAAVVLGTQIGLPYCPPGGGGGGLTPVPPMRNEPCQFWVSTCCVRTLSFNGIDAWLCINLHLGCISGTDLAICMEVKTCHLCKIRPASGRGSRCKPCNREYMRIYMRHKRAGTLPDKPRAGLKRCPKCREVKTKCNFSKTASYCRPCAAVYQRERRQRRLSEVPTLCTWCERAKEDPSALVCHECRKIYYESSGRVVGKC